MTAEAEFVQFVHEAGTRLYRTALLLTADHFLAEDLTQATLTKVFTSWRRARTAGDPVAYAHATLHNTFLSHRRVRRNSELPTEQLPEPPAAERAEPAVRLDLLAALRPLPALDRALLVSRYWEDRSVKETADLLGISEAAVRTRAKRALHRVRPMLSDDLPIARSLR